MVKQLYAIACDFCLEHNGPTHHGLAICSDPDTVVTFVFADGKPYKGEEVWTYKLRHFNPWIMIEVNEDSQHNID